MSTATMPQAHDASLDHSPLANVDLDDLLQSVVEQRQNVVDRHDYERKQLEGLVVATLQTLADQKKREAGVTLEVNEQDAEDSESVDVADDATDVTDDTEADAASTDTRGSSSVVSAASTQHANTAAAAASTPAVTGYSSSTAETPEERAAGAAARAEARAARRAQRDAAVDVDELLAATVLISNAGEAQREREAESAAAPAVATYTAADVLPLEKEADGLMASKEWEEALYKMDDCINAAGKSAEWRLYLKRGMCHIQLHNYEEAEMDLTQVIVRTQSCFEAYLERGSARIKMLKYHEACIDLEQALALKGDDERAFSEYRRARRFHGDGRPGPLPLVAAKVSASKPPSAQLTEEERQAQHADELVIEREFWQRVTVEKVAIGHE